MIRSVAVYCRISDVDKGGIDRDCSNPSGRANTALAVIESTILGLLPAASLSPDISRADLAAAARRRAKLKNFHEICGLARQQPPHQRDHQ
jgi:hypothetical protein